MVNPSSPIQLSDLQALATLANTKLSPTTPYAFPTFADTDQIGLPDPITATPTYNPSQPGLFAGTRVTLWLFAYKTIAGVKTYSYEPSTKAFYADPAQGTFTIKFDWPTLSVLAPDGFIAVLPQDIDPSLRTGSFFWKDIGNVSTLTLSDPNFTGWEVDRSYVPAVQLPGFSTADIPCAHGIWGKVLNTIYHDLLAKFDLFGGSTPFVAATHCVGGPEIISAGPKCYLQKNGKVIYNNLQFLYSPADSATGGQLSLEADMNSYTSGTTGANNLTFDTSGTINGTVTLFSSNSVPSSSDWTLTASDPSITTSIAVVQDSLGSFVTGLIFTLTNTPVTAGTPITLTCTPLTGGTVESPNGMQLAMVLTGVKSQQPTGTAPPIIHPSGTTGALVTLSTSLSAINMTSPGAIAFQSHWRAFCNGVYIANTLPTQGTMPFVDVDLPNYINHGFFSGSSQRVPKNPALADYQPLVDNYPSLWPIFKVSDFTPDSFFGQPYLGSKAWNILGTKQVSQSAYFLNPVTVPANGFVAETLPIVSTPPLQELRLLAHIASVQLYVKFGSPPSLSDADAILPGGQWNSLTPASAGWIPGSPVFVGFFNTTSTSQSVNAYEVFIDNQNIPNGFFFEGTVSDDGFFIPQLESESYVFDSPNDITTRPIPQFGYSIFKLTLSRIPGASNALSVDVDIGLMPGMGWGFSGTFQVIETFTIAAGDDSTTADVFIPVLGGTPLAYQASTGETLEIAPVTNFQAMVHSGFDLTNQQFLVGGSFSSVPVGYYDGQPFYNPDYALFFPGAVESQGGFGTLSSLDVLLPISASHYNDIEALLNLLP